MHIPKLLVIDNVYHVSKELWKRRPTTSQACISCFSAACLIACTPSPTVPPSVRACAGAASAVACRACLSPVAVCS